MQRKRVRERSRERKRASSHRPWFCYRLAPSMFGAKTQQCSFEPTWNCALFPQTWRNFQCGPIRKECEQYATPIRIAADTDVVSTSVRRKGRWINSPASQRAANSSNTDSKEETHRHIEKRTNSIGIYKIYIVRSRIRELYTKKFFFFCKQTVTVKSYTKLLTYNPKPNKYNKDLQL